MTKYPRDSLTDIQVHSLDTTEWNRLGRRHDILKVQGFPTDSSSNSIGRVYWYFRRLLLVGIDGLMSEDPIEIPTKVADGESLIESWERELDEGQLSPIHSDDLRHLADQTLENITINTLIHEKNRDEDIEVIFETLNSAREELGQFDLFRNFILIQSRKSGGAQKSLYEK